MAKSNPVTIPEAEFKQVFEPATAEAAYEAITDAREGTMMLVPFEAIHPIAGFNIRVHSPDYEAFIERTKESIKANGFFRHRPLKVHPSTENGTPLLYLADGYTRYEAAKRAVAEGAKITRLPVVSTPKGTSMDDLFVGLDADNDSRPLSAFEKGILVKRMLADGNDEDEVANKLRITKQYVGDLVQLMAAPKALHNMVVTGEVASALAIDLIKEHGGKKAVEVLKGAGATGNAPAANGQAGQPRTRVTRKNVAGSGGTANAGKRLYEALIEYLVVLNGTSGAQSAMDFLLKWQEKDPEAVKELQSKLGGRKKKAKGKDKKPKNPKDVRMKITDDMTDEQKKLAREHNKEVKKRKERRIARAAREAAKANGGDPDNAPI
jgi:ParB family transcriptional regulator, chromosome partitioning protein